MNLRAWSLLWALLMTACVLPDYSVATSKAEQPDAGQDASPIISESLLAGAEPDCQRCLQDHCQEPRDTCGADCNELEWPVSPAWQVSDQADTYVQCIAAQCEEACNVTWGCVKKYEFPEPSDDFSFTVRVTHAVQSTLEIEGVRITACSELDPSCQRGVGQVSSAVTDVQGEALLVLPRSFEGFFLIEPETSGQKDPYIPMVVVWSQPLYRVESLLTVSLFPQSLVPALASTVEKVQDGKGHFIFKAQNCLPERYVGETQINAEADGVVANYYSPFAEGSKVYYTRNGLIIDPNATDTSAEGRGYGGAFNLAAGPVSVTGAYNSNEVSSAGFPMRAEWLAVIFLLPKAQ